jgi:hypothetical protein
MGIPDDINTTNNTKEPQSTDWKRQNHRKPLLHCTAVDKQPPPFTKARVSGCQK